MNIHVPQNEMARAEVAALMMVENLIISPQSNKPVIGPVQNELLGISLFTQRDVFLTRAQTMDLVLAIEGLNGTTLDSMPTPAILKPEALWTGKQIFSLLLPKTLSMRRVANMHPKEQSRDNASTPTDTLVVVKRGELASGRLCKKTAGISGGGLIHITFLDYGPKACRELINGMQRIANHWMPTQGYSIGVQDAVTTPETKARVKAILDKAIGKVELMWKDYNANNVHHRNTDKLERQTNMQLNRALDTAADIAQSSLSDKNNVRRMTDVPSKGNKLNMTQITVCVGQQNVDGVRIQSGFNARTTPHFPKHDRGARSGGFIENSYITGLSPLEFFFHCMAGREGLIDTAVKTAKSGYIQRRLMKAHEDIVVHYDGTVRNSLGNIIQYVYGEDGVDGTYIEFQSARLGTLSNADFTKHYRWPSASAKRNRWVQREDTLLCEARRTMQEAIMARNDERLPLPIGLERMVVRMCEDAQYQGEPVMKTPATAIRLFFERFYDRVRVLPEHMHRDFKEINQSATQLFVAHALTYLASKPALQRYRLSETAYTALLDTLLTRFFRALVQPGEMVGPVAAHSIVQPATQMTLNTFHYTGISSKNQTSGLPRFEELIKVAKTTKTPSMVIYTKKGETIQYEAAVDLANALHHTCLADLVDTTAIYYDPDPLNTPSVVEADTETVQMFYMLESLDHLELTSFVLRLALRRETLLDKSIALKDVQRHVSAYLCKHMKDNTFVVFTNDESDETLFLRIRPAHVKKKASAAATRRKRRKVNTGAAIAVGQEEEEEEDAAHAKDASVVLLESVIDTLSSDAVTIKGIPRLLETEVREARVSAVRDGEVTTFNEYVIDTLGSNLEAVWQCDDVDPLRTISNEIIETLRTLGIEACRTLLYNELERVLSFDYINYRHLSLLIDVMTHRGYLMPMSRFGLNRMGTGPLKRSSFEETYEMLLEAAMFAELDELKGISENIMTGNLAPMGTGFMAIRNQTSQSRPTLVAPNLRSAKGQKVTTTTTASAETAAAAHVDLHDVYLDDDEANLLAFGEEEVDDDGSSDEDDENDDAYFDVYADSDDDTVGVDGDEDAL